MEIKDYRLGNTIIRFMQDENERVSFIMFPQGKEDIVQRRWEQDNEYDPAARYNREWELGSPVQLQLAHHTRSMSNGNTMKYSESVKNLKFRKQEFRTDSDKEQIITELASDGYAIIHRIIHIHGMEALIFKTEFVNESDKEMTIEMLSSFALDNISPFRQDDGRGNYYFHRFRSGWSMEGRHICESIEELNLEKAWAGSFYETEKFGCIGNWNVGRYFPMACVEDREHNIFWTVQLEHNASWQMELSRNKDSLSFSGGIADADFGAWSKKVMPSERFEAPAAYVAVTEGDIFKACQTVTKIQNIACENYGEEGLPICFNEFCTSWGAPSQEKVMSYAETLKDKGIKYLVIDAGWSEECKGGQMGNGTWKPDKKIFPDMRGMCEEIRKMGMIPGIWMEFEVTTDGSSAYKPEYDDLKLKRNGVVINHAGWRNFWDFRKPEVIKLLTENVINFLKEYGFGYLKVDFNGNVGLGCDGAESLGEGLRQHMESVAGFFKKIKQEIPDIIIENCASGGHRSEPKMIGLTAVTSASDAHECIEIPYISANMHNLMLPRQSLIWATLRKTDSERDIIYKMASTFLGRVCLSGDVDKLSAGQWELISDGLEFYKKSENVIKDGITRIYRSQSKSMRYPKGTQVAVREGRDEILVVCHAFEDHSQGLSIELPFEAEIEAGYNADGIYTENSKLYIPETEDFSAKAVLLKRKMR